MSKITRATGVFPSMTERDKLTVLEITSEGRRRFLGSALLSAAGFAAVATLSGCTVTTTNGVTTLTLDVAKVKNYGQAGLNAAAAVTSFLSGFPVLAPYALAITAAETALSGALTAFSNAAGSTLSISYDNADWKTRVDSILSDLDTLSGTIERALAGSGSVLSSSVQANADTAYKALATLISVFKALLGVSDSRAPAGGRVTRAMVRIGAPVPATGMTEAGALAILGIR